ncbi:MAG: hypothetical protein ACLQIQ_06150 [Beijerinckiaceae bacterium]
MPPDFPIFGYRLGTSARAIGSIRPIGMRGQFTMVRFDFGLRRAKAGENRERLSVSEKYTHFSDKDMLQLIELARIPIDRVNPPDRHTRPAADVPLMQRRREWSRFDRFAVL